MMSMCGEVYDDLTGSKQGVNRETFPPVNMLMSSAGGERIGWPRSNRYELEGPWRLNLLYIHIASTLQNED